MSDRQSINVRVDVDTWESFQKFVVEKHGQKYGNLGREVGNALDEYVDRDRATRIEEKVDRVLDRLDDIDDSHTHKHSETSEKVATIAERLADQSNSVMPADDVRRVIEDVAGADPRTIKKYQRQLKRHGEAYEHPAETGANVWTLKRGRWVEWAEKAVNNTPGLEVHDVIEDYPLDFDDYDRAVTEVVTQ
jgi:hypothetical protein